MKKCFVLFAFTLVTLIANAQFTTYQSINPNVPQRQSIRDNSDYPFTTYQYVDPYIRNNSNRYSIQQNLKIVRGVYLDAISDEAQYIKIKVADNGSKLYAKSYYDARTDQWFQCNSEITALGMYDDAELREYFSYKVRIPNIGTVYY
ncbi:MAG: hypothetical protein UC738_11090 [Bacteroides stercoris]|nr:hypothetical protein [Bacteroides stercoris]